MNGHCRGPRFNVVLSEEGVVGRTEECLSSTCGHTSEDNDCEHRGGHPGEHRGHTPEQYRNCHHPFPAETVSRPTSQRYHKGIEEIEQSGNKPYLRVGQAEGIPD